MPATPARPALPPGFPQPRTAEDRAIAQALAQARRKVRTPGFFDSELVTRVLAKPVRWPGATRSVPLAVLLEMTAHKHPLDARYRALLEAHGVALFERLERNGAARICVAFALSPGSWAAHALKGAHPRPALALIEDTASFLFSDPLVLSADKPAWAVFELGPAVAARKRLARLTDESLGATSARTLLAMRAAVVSLLAA